MKPGAFDFPNDKGRGARYWTPVTKEASGWTKA